MTVLKVCGIAVIGAVSALVFREFRKEYAALTAFITSLIIFSYALAAFSPSVSFITELIGKAGFSVYASTLLKALGIGAVGQFAADICRDLGESAVAGRIELAAKACILLLGLPVIKSIVETAVGVLE
ncbi:MAG: stage III sporulation protein AD [Clostridia bacterium]|nr:stage III sporulation protein AD [Clostridia bacterium]